MEVDFVASREAGKLCLWAVDLTICPTASLSGYQLFDFLAAGQFDPVTGTYWVPGMPETPDVDTAALPDQLAEHQPEPTDAASALASTHHATDTAAQPVDGDSQQAALTAEVQGSSRHEAAVGVAVTEHISVDAPEHNQHESAPSAEAVSTSQEHRHHSSVADADQTYTSHLIESADAAADAAAAAAAQHNSCEEALAEISRRPLTQCSEAVGGGESYHIADAAAVGVVASPSIDQELSASDMTGDQRPQEQASMQELSNDAVAWQQAESAVLQQEVQLEPRCYAAIDLLFHSGMHKRRSAQFLQNCRLAGLGFDMMARQGLVLNFMDSMSSCCLGVQCAAPTPQLALQDLSKVMHLVTQSL